MNEQPDGDQPQRHLSQANDPDQVALSRRSCRLSAKDLPGLSRNNPANTTAISQPGQVRSSAATDSDSAATQTSSGRPRTCAKFNSARPVNPPTIAAGT